MSEDGLCPVMGRINVGRHSEAAFSAKLSASPKAWMLGRATGKSRHMRLDDLKLLMGKQIDAPNLQRVRDWFIFSTFTGLAYADLKLLSEDDISQAPDGTWWIQVNRQKTGSRSAIRLLDIPMRIMEKYRDERQDGKIFNYYCSLKVIDHQKIKAGILARMSAFLCYFAFTTKHKQL